MKKGICILAAVFMISCGKGFSDQNQSVENVQAPTPQEPKIMTDDEYLKSIALNYIGSDSYGTGLNCSYDLKNNNYTKCEYIRQNNQDSIYSIELSAKGIFKINKEKVKKKYECNEYSDCAENSKNYNCKISYKKFEYNSELEMCDIYGVDYGFIYTLNEGSIFLKSKISYYKFIFSKNF